MKAMVRDAVQEVALGYRVQNVFEPLHPAGIWGISLFDPDAPPGYHIFQIVIGPVDETRLDEARAELINRLREHRHP